MKHALMFFALALLTTLPASADGVRDWDEAEINDVVGSSRALIGRTDGLQEKLANLKTNIERIVSQVNEGVAGLTGEMRSMFRNGLDEVKAVIAEERDGLDAFLGGGCKPGSPCGDFRERLVALVMEVEGLTNDLLASPALAGLHVDFRPLVAVLESAPGPTLYPVYRALSVETNFMEGGAAMLKTTRERLLLAKECLGIGADAPAGADECAQLGSDPEQCLQTAKDLRNVGTLLTVIGRILMALGETNFQGEFQIHGYVGGTITNNRKKKVGTILVGVADALKGMGDSLENKVRYCVLRGNQEAILRNQQLILNRLGVPGGEGGGGGTGGTGCQPLADDEADDCDDRSPGKHRGESRRHRR